MLSLDLTPSVDSETRYFDNNIYLFNLFTQDIQIKFSFMKIRFVSLDKIYTGISLAEVKYTRS